MTGDKESRPGLKIPQFGFLFRNQSLLFFAALVIGISVHFVIMKRIGFSNQVALFDALVSNLILSVMVLILKHIQDNYHTSHPVTLVNVAILNAFSLVCVLGLVQAARFYYAGHSEYLHFLEKNAIARGAIAFLLLLLTLYQLWIYKNQATQEKILRQKLDIERQLNQAELANIEQQLQPHFIFNSLNSISALTIVQPDEARRMVQLLSDFLRGTLRRDTGQEVKLEEELQHIGLYLEIEKVRFGHRLRTDIRLDEACRTAMIPSLILQPMIENCIKYGLYGSTEDLVIRIEASCRDQFLYLSVSNPFDPESLQTSRGTGFGLDSIARKLSLLYSRTDLLRTQKEEGIFTVRLMIPQKQS